MRILQDNYVVENIKPIRFLNTYFQFNKESILIKIKTKNNIINLTLGKKNYIDKKNPDTYKFSEITINNHRIIKETNIWFKPNTIIDYLFIEQYTEINSLDELLSYISDSNTSIYITLYENELIFTVDSKIFKFFINNYKDIEYFKLFKTL